MQNCTFRDPMWRLVSPNPAQKRKRFQLPSIFEDLFQPSAHFALWRWASRANPEDLDPVYEVFSRLAEHLRIGDSRPASRPASSNRPATTPRPSTAPQDSASSFFTSSEGPPPLEPQFNDGSLLHLSLQELDEKIEQDLAKFQHFLYKTTYMQEICKQGDVEKGGEPPQLNAAKLYCGEIIKGEYAEMVLKYMKNLSDHDTLVLMTSFRRIYRILTASSYLRHYHTSPLALASPSRFPQEKKTEEPLRPLSRPASTSGISQHTRSPLYLTSYARGYRPRTAPTQLQPMHKSLSLLESTGLGVKVPIAMSSTYRSTHPGNLLGRSSKYHPPERGSAWKKVLEETQCSTVSLPGLIIPSKKDDPLWDSIRDVL